MPKEPVVHEAPGVVQESLGNIIHNSMLPYAEYVILERALPRVEDGLKPVQRRLLYAMHELGLSPDKPHRKSARIVGDCLGKYHPHGDTSVYDALVRLAQPFSMRGLLADGHGNFGSIDGDSAAAMRYTEARLAPLAVEMLRDIHKDTVPFRLNFDDTLHEPELLPARYPNLLVNGASGIAVGLATNIPPHNLRETIQAVLLLMDKPDASLEELMQVLPAPDFPTGGVLLNTPEIRTAYETGRGRLTLRAKITVEPGRAGRSLLCIHEVPYQVNKALMLERILRLTEEKKAALGCIVDIRDESDRSGMRAVIELKRDADPDAVLSHLYRYSDLQVTFGVNMVAILEGKPVLMGLTDLLKGYIAHQKKVVSGRTRYDLDQALARAHVLKGLMTAVDHLDEVLELIRRSSSPKEAKEGLIRRFGFSDIQAQAILDMRLQRLTGLEILALRQELTDTESLIANLGAILNSEKKLLRVIRDELTKIANAYGDSRRTAVVREDEALEALPIDDTPVPEDAVVFLTRGGQFRRMHPRIFEKLEAATDASAMPRFLLKTRTDHELLLFTTAGQCYVLPVAQLEDSVRPRDRGISLSGVLSGLGQDECPVAMLELDPSSRDTLEDIVFFTAMGTVKRSAASEYAVRRAKFAALKLREGDSLVGACFADARSDLGCLSEDGLFIRFTLDQVPRSGRGAIGVRAMKLRQGSCLLWGGTLKDDDQILLFSDRGYGKRIPGTLLDAQARGGKGIRVFRFNKNHSNGSKIAAAARLHESGSFFLLQAGGQLTPFLSEEVAFQSPADRGKPYLIALLDDVVTDILL